MLNRRAMAMRRIKIMENYICGPTNYASVEHYICGQNHTPSLMYQLFVKEKHWNIQLLVDGKLFKCHRFVLGAASEYFDTMFSSSGFKESSVTPDQPITLREVDVTAFEEILYFMYTSEVRVNYSNVLQLLVLNDYLQLQTTLVKDNCTEFLENNRSLQHGPIPNALDLLCFACLKDDFVLIHTLSAHIFPHLCFYTNDARLMEFSFENLRELLLCSEDYIVPLPGSSDVPMIIIHNWVNCNRKERSEYLEDLIGCIDYSKVSSDFALLLKKKMENAVDEMKLPRNIQSTSELKTLGMGIDIYDIGGNSRPCATISLNIKNISKRPKGVPVFSPWHIISNLSWKTSFSWNHESNYAYIRVIGCTDSTIEWNCYIRIIFTIKSKNFQFETSDLFQTADGLNFHQQCRIRIHFDQKTGFVEDDDDSLTIDTHLRVDMPFRWPRVDSYLSEETEEAKKETRSIIFQSQFFHHLRRESCFRIN